MSDSSGLFSLAFREGTGVRVILERLLTPPHPIPLPPGEGDIVRALNLALTLIKGAGIVHYSVSQTVSSCWFR
jgi:hypothetical protein